MANTESKAPWAVINTALAVASLVSAYLFFAYTNGMMPFGSAELTVVTPAEDYVVDDDFLVSVSGKVASGQHIWIVAVNSAEAWYPLREAARDPASGEWTAVIAKRQILGSLDICAVTADERATDILAKFFRRAERDSKGYVRGLENHPQGATRHDCVNVSSA